MRSLYTKIMVWMVATLALSFLVFVLIDGYLRSRSQQQGQFFGRLVAMQFEDARAAFEHGGKPELAAYIERLNRYFPGEHYFLDANGRDLLTSSDRSGLLAQPQEPPPRWPGWGGPRNPVRRISLENKYHFVIVRTPPVEFGSVLPYYAPVVLVVLLLGYLLAKHLLTPVRHLRATVASFGEGGLSSRINSLRKDEIGDLERAFDTMADRIQTLLTAERRLLQDISHELRSPLARLGFAVELAKTSADPEAAFARIKQEIGRLTALVGELLQVTRAEGDPGSRNLQHLRLDELVHAVVEDCAIEAEVRHCKIVPSLDGPASLNGDSELLRRAIENVLRNAIRHAPEGSKVEVNIEREDSVIAVAIRDYGPGVPSDMLGEIFKPFFRVDSDRNRASGGSGLGLAIAQRAVHLHHGELKAFNQSPGLLVRMTLPLQST